MPDTPAKREREARKRRHREVKAERKRLRKEGLLGSDLPAQAPPPAPPAPDQGLPEGPK